MCMCVHMRKMGTIFRGQFISYGKYSTHTMNTGHRSKHLHSEDSTSVWPAFQPNNPSEGLDMEVSVEKLGNLCSRAEETRAEENASQLRQQPGNHLVPRASSLE